MRSASNTTVGLHRPGRHRLGLAGLVPVSSLAGFTRPSFFARLFHRGRHRHSVGTPVTSAPALGTVSALPAHPSAGAVGPVRGPELTAA